jgi:hypothetical protein
MKQFRFIPALMAVAWMTAADVRLVSAQEVTVGNPQVEKIGPDRDRDHRRRDDRPDHRRRRDHDRVIRVDRPDRPERRDRPERPERRDRPERQARPDRPVRR